MACSKSLRTEFLSGADLGGEWSLEGYNDQFDTGPFGAGGNWPWTSNVDDNPSVIFDNIEQGYYSLDYFKAGACPDTENVVIAVIGSAQADPGPNNVNKCSSDLAFNVWNQFVALNNARYDQGNLEVVGSWSGTATLEAGWNPGSKFTEATFNPSQSANGTYSLTLTLTPTAPGPYTKVVCDNCNAIVTTINIVISDQYSAGEDTIVNICNSELPRNLLNDMNGSPSANGNWAIIQGDASGFDLSNDGNGANDEIIPQNLAEGTYILEYTTLANGSCPGLTRILTYNVSQYFNSGGGTLTSNPINICDYDGRGNECNILDVISAWLSDQGRAPLTPGGAWQYWSHKYNTCGGAGTGGDISVNGGACTRYSPFQEFSGPGTSPEVRFDCEANTACVGIIYIAPPGHPCPFSSLYWFAPGNCGTCTCQASIDATGCLAEVTPINCVNPTYQWQEWNGSIWLDIVGQIASTYTGSDGDEIRCQVADDNCPLFVTNVLVLSCAPNCNGAVSITNNGCVLSSAISNITTPQYQWQERPVGGGSWTNIPAATLSQYTTGANNAQYRVEVTDNANGCVYYSNIITIDVLVTISINSCVASSSISGNLGSPAYQWQRATIGQTNWSNIVGAVAAQYTSSGDEDLRLRVTYNGCTFTSNTITALCAPPSCTLQIDALYQDGCDLVCEFSGYSGSQIIQWSWAQINNNPGSCLGSSGWSSAGVGTIDNATPGVSRLTPAQGGRCYRIIVDDIANQGPGCMEVDEEWFTGCCNDGVTIGQETCNYSIDAYKEGDPLSPTLCKVTFEDQTNLAHTFEAQATVQCGVGPVEDYQASEVRTFLRSYSMCPINIGPPNAIALGEYVSVLRIHIDDNGAIAQHDLDLSAVVHSNQGASVFASALRAEMVSALTGLGLTENTHYQFYQFYCTLYQGKYTLNISMVSKDRQPGDKWAGIDKTDHTITITDGVTPRTFSNFSGQGGASSVGGQIVSRTTPCGNLVSVEGYDAFPYLPNQFIQANCNWNTLDYTTNDQTLDKRYSPQTAQCIKLTATAQGGCTPVSYLWSTGDTDQVIYVEAGAGTISVTITCSNGCTYNDSINV